MKIIFSIIAANLLFNSSIYSQSLERKVISSSGNTLSAPGISMDYTIGELAISTFSNNGIILTQGFHQPQSSLCLGDFNHDGLINLPDLLLMLSEYGCLSNCGTDLSDDGQVTIDDLLTFLSMFGNNCD